MPNDVTSPSKRETLPPRLLPVLYFGCAHAALAVALAVTALDPRAIGGFFYHDRLIALVHLVTLGWISLSILGALYIVGPLALRMPMPARRIDYAIWALVVIGLIGMATHFWIEEYGGMAWSAGTAAAGFTLMALRMIGRLRAAPVAWPVKLHIGLAFANILGAATMGILLALDKIHPFLGGYVLTNVFAHAHLAVIGWASMIVVGIGYRLLPMMLPSAMPDGWSTALSAILLETGAIGLFVSLLRRSRWTPVFGGLVIAGFAAFAAHVVWMLRHPRPTPARRPRPDYGVWHVAAALVYLGLTCVTGMVLAIAPLADWTLRVAIAYGVFALLGFLAQMIVGVQARILPMFAWYHAFAATGFAGPVPPPDALPSRALQEAVFWLWLLGVPSVAGGFALDAVPFLAAGAWLLLAATVLSAVDALLILRPAWRRRPPASPTAGSPPQPAG